MHSILLLLFTFEKIKKRMQMSQWSQFSPEEKVMNFALCIPLMKPCSLTNSAPLFCVVLSYKVSHADPHKSLLGLGVEGAGRDKELTFPLHRNKLCEGRELI